MDGLHLWIATAQIVVGACQCACARSGARALEGDSDRDPICTCSIAHARSVAHARRIARARYMRNQVQIGSMKERQLFIITCSFSYPQSSRRNNGWVV
jgi:hypothetical protein